MRKVIKQKLFWENNRKSKWQAYICLLNKFTLLYMKIIFHNGLTTKKKKKT